MLPKFDCNLSCGSDSHDTGHHYLPSESDSKLHLDLHSNQYKLLYIIFNRLVPDHVSSIYSECMLDHSKKDKIHLSTKSLCQDQHTHENWGDDNQISTHNTVDIYIDKC